MYSLLNFACVWYPRGVGAIFALIAATMLTVPAMNLGGDGVDFEAINTAGKAEIRAWYFGTALVVTYACFFLHTKSALAAVYVTLGGFWVARVVGYSLDGVDADPNLALRQHVVFAAEVAGSMIGFALHRVAPAAPPGRGKAE